MNGCHFCKIANVWCVGLFVKMIEYWWPVDALDAEWWNRYRINDNHSFFEVHLCWHWAMNFPVCLVQFLQRPRPIYRIFLRRINIFLSSATKSKINIDLDTCILMMITDRKSFEVLQKIYEFCLFSNQWKRN